MEAVLTTGARRAIPGESGRKLRPTPPLSVTLGEREVQALCVSGVNLSLFLGADMLAWEEIAPPAQSFDMLQALQQSAVRGRPTSAVGPPPWLFVGQADGLVCFIAEGVLHICSSRGSLHASWAVGVAAYLKHLDATVHSVLNFPGGGPAWSLSVLPWAPLGAGRRSQDAIRNMCTSALYGAAVAAEQAHAVAAPRGVAPPARQGGIYVAHVGRFATSLPARQGGFPQFISAGSNVGSILRAQERAQQYVVCLSRAASAWLSEVLYGGHAAEAGIPCVAGGSTRVEVPRRAALPAAYAGASAAVPQMQAANGAPGTLLTAAGRSPVEARRVMLLSLQARFRRCSLHPLPLRSAAWSRPLLTERRKTCPVVFLSTRLQP